MPGEGLTHGPPATKKAGGSHHGFSQINRHSPRNGFNGVVLPGDRTGDRAFLPPSSARSSSRQLGISVGMPGPHDFAVRNDISRPHKDCALNHRVHRIPLSTLVTIAKRPSCESRTAGHNTISDFRQQKIFQSRPRNRCAVESTHKIRLFAGAIFARLRRRERRASAQHELIRPTGNRSGALWCRQNARIEARSGFLKGGRPWQVNAISRRC
jgi:hypothetical protein